jgi:hypothetical protein
LDVLNNHCSLSAVTDIIKFATMKYPSVPIHTPNGPHNHTQHPLEEDRLNRTSDVAHKMFEMLGIVGLKNQNLRNMQFDVLGGSWIQRRTGSEGLGMDPRYMDPNDRRLPNPFAKTILDLCHPNMIAMSFNQGIGGLTFDRKKILNYAVGLEDPMSPLSYLDRDVGDYVGIELSRRPIKYHNPETQRRNFFSQGERENRIRAFQRLNTARGLDSLTSHIGPRSGIDMGNIMDIMGKHSGIGLVEDAKYPENKMSREYYELPVEIYERGDMVTWGDNYGSVLADGKKMVKILSNKDGKKYFIPKGQGRIKKIDFSDEGPTLNPGSPPLDGGSNKRRKRTRRKKR